VTAVRKSVFVADPDELIKSYFALVDGREVGHRRTTMPASNLISIVSQPSYVRGYNMRLGFN
jgi:hypothetical protein